MWVFLRYFMATLRGSLGQLCALAGEGSMNRPHSPQSARVAAATGSPHLLRVNGKGINERKLRLLTTDCGLLTPSRLLATVPQKPARHGKHKKRQNRYGNYHHNHGRNLPQTQIYPAKQGPLPGPCFSIAYVTVRGTAGCQKEVLCPQIPTLSVFP